MSDRPTEPPLSAPPPDPMDRIDLGSDDSRRPWWGIGDVWLGFVVFFGAAVVGGLAGLPFIDSSTAADLGRGVEGVAEQVPSVIAGSILAQQLAQALWPFFVSRWKGLGARLDWRVGFEWVDIGIGIGTGLIGLVAATLAGQLLTALLGLVDEAAADNTQFLVASRGTPWMWLIVAAVVIGAPISEELFFRGLTLRALERRAGTVWAIVGSSIIFTLPHVIGAGWRAQFVLWGSIFAVGCVLAVAALRTNRLGAPIVAHMVFNAVGAAGAFGLFDGLV